MNDLEDITEKVHKAYFVDLFVRVSNATAIQMYNKVSADTLFYISMTPCYIYMPPCSDKPYAESYSFAAVWLQHIQNSFGLL